MTSQREPTRPVLVIIGPSGCGKSTVARALVDRNLVRLHPTWTTRPRRADEQEGTLEHVFVSEADFDRWERQGLFIDTVTLFGLPYRYGLPVFQPSSSGPADAVMLRAPLVSRFAEVVPHLLVYQVEDDVETARARLRRRGCTAAEISGRLDAYLCEISSGRAVADRVFVNDGPLDQLFDAVADAVSTDIGCSAVAAA
jgi:guanylate kinase